MTWTGQDLAAEVDRADRAVRQAPAPLDVVQALVNTLNRIRGYDLLEDLPTARWWLSRLSADLDTDRLEEPDLTELVDLREALRALLRSTTSGEPVDRGALAVLGEAGRRHPLAVTLDAAGVPRVEPVPTQQRPAETLAARALAALPAAAGAGTLPRLKACANPDCEWAFYDTSRSRSGSWCVMNVCGARHKMSRYRARQRSGAAEDPSSAAKGNDPSAPPR